MKDKVNIEFDESIKHLRKAKRLVKKIGFCNVTQGHIEEELDDIIDTIERDREQFEYFYHKEKEGKSNFKVIV